MNNNNDDNMRYEVYYYLGQHVDGCDMYGQNNVYHYISEKLLNGRNLNIIDLWEYDLELWPGDKYWLDAGINKQILMIEVNNTD